MMEGIAIFLILFGYIAFDNWLSNRTELKQKEIELKQKEIDLLDRHHRQELELLDRRKSADA